MNSERIDPYILVVDDEPDLRLMTATCLRDIAGFRITTAVNGLDALRVMDEFGRPEVMVSDLNMPEMSGVELVHAMRKSILLRDVPVIIVSGEHQWHEEARQLAVTLIRKPCSKDELIHVVRQALRLA